MGPKKVQSASPLIKKARNTIVIKDMCAKWSELQSFVEKYHPNKAVASRVCNTFNDNALSHFRQIIQRHQKQTSLDRFFVQQGSSDSQAGPSASK